jgi:hypothetical protein
MLFESSQAPTQTIYGQKQHADNQHLTDPMSKDWFLGKTKTERVSYIEKYRLRFMCKSEIIFENAEEINMSVAVCFCTLPKLGFKNAFKSYFSSKRGEM